MQLKAIVGHKEFFWMSLWGNQGLWAMHKSCGYLQFIKRLHGDLFGDHNFHERIKL
jgi:hypothetical protein